uniref:Uncharacterized protein n=1 Tax=mine drainage metagenome TaxID=410659 RepID=E6QLT4_9ZZZZ
MTPYQQKIVVMNSYRFQHMARAFARPARKLAENLGFHTVFAESLCVPIGTQSGFWIPVPAIFPRVLIGTLSAIDRILEHRPPIPCLLDQHPTGSVKLPFCFYGSTLTFQSTPLAGCNHLTRRMKGAIMT